jgi:N-acetylglucosamine kinase-like BadF-type ATPase
VSHVVVALDVGKTNLRVEVRERGSCRLRVGTRVRGWMGAPGPRAALLTQLAEVCGRLPGAGSLTSAGAGIAGYESAAAEEKDEVSRALRMALPRARVRVASDARTAHLGAFRGGPGALLVAGTGAVALAVDPAGASYWAGGLGPVHGDEGSGGWIGREGCLAAARSIDARGPATALAQRCERTFGVAATQLGALAAASPSPAGLFGRFAPDVLEAWLEGDEQAARIAEHAAAHLAAAAIAVLRRLDAQNRRFAVVGGLSTHATFAAALTARVAAAVPGAVCVPARGDALDGAALLASLAVLPVPHHGVSRAARGSGA